VFIESSFVSRNLLESKLSICFYLDPDANTPLNVDGNTCITAPGGSDVVLGITDESEYTKSSSSSP